jgi:hypothetical protein
LPHAQNHLITTLVNYYDLFSSEVKQA